MRKTRFILLILAAAVLAAGLGACNFKKDTETPKFYGKWETEPRQNNLGYWYVELWEFNEDGTFFRGFDYKMPADAKQTLEEHFAERAALGLEPTGKDEMYGTYSVEDGLLVMTPTKLVSGGETSWLKDVESYKYNYDETYENDELTALFLKPLPDLAGIVRESTTIYKVK